MKRFYVSSSGAIQGHLYFDSHVFYLFAIVGLSTMRRFEKKKKQMLESACRNVPMNWTTGHLSFIALSGNTVVLLISDRKPVLQIAHLWLLLYRMIIPVRILVFCNRPIQFQWPVIERFHLSWVFQIFWWPTGVFSHCLFVLGSCTLSSILFKSIDFMSISFCLETSKQKTLSSFIHLCIKP